MHFHLVNVAVRKRERWKFDPQSGAPILPLQPISGSARPADPNEQGWKETVRMNPGEVVTVDMKFDLPAGKLAPPSPRLQASYGITGFEYVWHCHILEHEEHDMMHALVVI
jgi:spore coat protein A